MRTDLLGACLQASRNRAGMSRKAAGSAIGVSHKSIEAYEIGGVVPAPDIVASMSRAYKDSSLRKQYCKLACAIGQECEYVRLNNVNLDVATILLKLVQEYEEAGVAIVRLQALAINKRSREDFSDKELADLKDCSHELHDLIHNIDELHLQLDQLGWVSEAETVREHNSKCYSRRYAVNDCNLPRAG